MTKKRVLLVGVSSGLGLMVAERMATQGVALYAAAPELEPLRKLETRGTRLLEMDVTSDESVATAVATMLGEQGGIDCVFSNPGLHVSGAIEIVPQETVDRLYQVNVMGAARLIRAIAPTMRKQRSGRMIFTSSAVAHISLPMAGWYASTKHALRGMLDAFRHEVRGLGIEVVMIEPGQINTGFDQASIERLKDLDHPADYQPFVDGYVSAMQDRLETAPDATRTADAIQAAILADRAKRVVRTTSDARLLPAVANFAPASFIDALVARGFQQTR